MAEFQSILAVTNDWKGCSNDGWGKKKKTDIEIFLLIHLWSCCLFQIAHPFPLENVQLDNYRQKPLGASVTQTSGKDFVSNVKNMKANSLTENKGSVYFQLNKTALRFLRGTKLMHIARNPHQNNLIAGCISIKTPDRDPKAAMLPSRPCGLHLGS